MKARRPPLYQRLQRSGDSGSDAAVVLVVLLGVLLLAANGMKHGMAPVVACDDEDKNKSCDDNEVQN